MTSPVPLLLPAEGVPPVSTTMAEIAAAARRLAAGEGPLAVDAERASGFRYSQRAYLIQLRRAGAGTVLIDPIAAADELAPLAEVANELEWVLHAADQDLPCLAELGLTPAHLFDTELAGRLAGFERVGLAPIVERTLGFELRKGHGADDWSTRPLPEDWLVYAALDVEVLVELRAAMVEELSAQGKTEWAAQEFEHVRCAGAAPAKPDRWRRTSGIHTLRRPRQLAVARELWLARDELAASRDIAPGRVLPDAAIVAAAAAIPTTVSALRALPVFGGARQRRLSGLWLDAVTRAHALSEADLPPLSQKLTGPPPPNRWERRNPEAAARLTAARAAMAGLSEEVKVPVENLLTPDLVRRLCWDWITIANDRAPDTDTSTGEVATAIDAFLAVGGARAWQRALAVGPLTTALG